MGYKSTNNAYSTLASAISNSATSLTVQSGKGDLFPVIASPDFTFLTLENEAGDREIVKVTARASGSNVMTIVRAQENFSARSWLAGDTVALRFTSGTFNLMNNSVSGILSKDVSGNADITLTANEAINGIIILTGTLTGNINVNVPADSMKWLVVNNTTGEFSITFKTSSGSGVSITQSSANTIFCDKTNVVQGQSSDFSWITNKPTTLAGYGITDALRLSGGTLTGALNEAQGTEVASAATVNLATATGNHIHITGTVNITAITLAQGSRRTVVFDDSLTLTYGASLRLPTGASIVTAAGDSATFIGEAAGVVRCVSYVRATGNPLNEGLGSSIASAATVNLATATGDYVHITGTTDITAITLPKGEEFTVVFDGVLTLTNGASLILPSGANITTAAGDTATFRGEASGVVRCITYQHAREYSSIKQLTAKTASGTSVEFTSIPSWVKRITIMFSDLSTNGANSLYLQIASSSTYDTTGYYANCIRIVNDANPGTTNISNGLGFILDAGTQDDASVTRTGVITLSKLSGNTWVCNGSYILPTINRNMILTGTKTLSATLDRVRLIANSTLANLFDNGTVNIMYEG